MHASEQSREDVAAEREEWMVTQKLLDAKKLVFLDETGVSTNMARTRGRCARGERLKASIPHGHWKTTTFLAGLRHDDIVAPFVIAHPMDGDIFLAYVERFLAPTLKRNDIVIMDNLSAHKVTGVREAIEARGAKLIYLPRYSPDLNPIEKLFAKFKAAMRKAARRTIPTLWAAIRKTLKTFTPEECANYLESCGYVSK